MPHQCVRCGTLHDDGDKAILVGCKNCGKKVFFFIRKERMEELQKEPVLNLDDKDKVELEKDIYEMIGETEPDQPVVLDFESIRVLKPGKYEFDLVSLFKKQPIIFKLSEGKYMIDLPTTFKELGKK